jgi:DNA-binding NarL/FixJ family response regulator
VIHPGNFDWSPWRVLIVDRDEQFRFFARGLFKHQRVADIISSPYSRDLPRLVAHNPLHLAFVELTPGDTVLPSVLEWLRDPKRSPVTDLPVVLLAAELDRMQLAAVCAFGIHGVLQKPLSGAKMLAAAQGVLTSPRLFKLAGEPAKPRLPSPPSRHSQARPSPPARLARPVAAAVVAEGRGDGLAPPSAEPAAAGQGEAGQPTAGRADDGVGVETAQTKRRRRRDWSDEDAGPTSGAVETIETVATAREVDGGEIETVAKKPVRRTTAADPTSDDQTGPPRQPVGPDVEAILARHARWVEAGGQDGERARLEGFDLSGRQLSGAVLTSALLRRVDLSAADAGGALFHGADLRNADATGTRFVGADLAVARLRHARLVACQFAGASLKGADLAGADLSGAQMGDADLSGAILLGAQLAGADLAGVVGLTQGQLDDVAGDAQTRLPPGLSLPQTP